MRSQTKKERFYFVTLKWHRSTCYVNWAILIGDPVDVTILLLNVARLEYTLLGWQLLCIHSCAFVGCD